MPSPAELVAALSRAYALTDVFPAGDPVSLDALGHLRGLLREGASVAVSPAGLRVDGIDVPDFHGGSGRFARDLRMLGVEELHFAGELEVEALERFVRVLREDAREGRAAHLRPVTHGSGIDVVFQGERAAPGEETEVIPFPRVADQPASDPRPLQDAGPGRALVASIAGLFDPAPGPTPPPSAAPSTDTVSPAPSTPSSSSLAHPAPADDPEERDPDLVEDIEAMLGREFAEPPEPPDPPRELELDPNFGWAPDPEAGVAGDSAHALDPSSLDAAVLEFPSPDNPLWPSDRQPPPTSPAPSGVPSRPLGEGGGPTTRSFTFPPRPGSRRIDPGVDPDWDPFDARESMKRARSGIRGEDPSPQPPVPPAPPGLARSQPGSSTPESSTPAPSSPPSPPPVREVGPAGSLPFASEGVVGDVSFGRRLDPGGHPLDSPSSVRDASFADPETMGEAHFGHSEPSSSSRENKPFLDWPPREETSPGSGPVRPPAEPPRQGSGPDPFQDLLGLAGQGESSHALFFFDEDVGAGKGDDLFGEGLMTSPPTEPDEPGAEEMEVDPPSEEWDRVQESLSASSSSGEGDPSPGSMEEDEEVPLWHLEPEVPIWDRQEEGSAETVRGEEGETLDTLVHRVLISFGEQRRRAMDELRARATPTLNPVVLDEFANAVLDLLRGEETGSGLRDLARDLTTHGVASRLVARLGQERDPELRRELSGLFSRIGETMSRALVDALVEEPDRSTRRIYLESLSGMGPEGVGAVHRMLNDARWFVVRNGLSLLGDMGDPAAVARIVPVLGHPDPRVRREAVVALGRLPGEDLPRILQQRLGDPSGEVRAAAASALGSRGAEEAAPALMALLDSEKDTGVLEAVMGALGELGEPAAVALLEKRAVGSLLSRPPTQVRVAAYRALWAVGTPHARSVVQAAANDRDPGVRSAVASLLAR